MAKEKMDYKKIGMPDMVEWIEEHEQDPEKKKEFKRVAVGEDGKLMTVKAKQKFYALYKDEIDFVNAPIKKTMSKAARTQNARDLLSQW